MVRPGLLIVIPCHNEASTLRAVVSGAVRFGEVLVVDDRSTDASRETAIRLGARVVASAATGYDGALETGLREAFARGYAHVVTMDADGEHDPLCLEAFVSRFEAGAELVCGYRARPQRLAEYLAVVVGLALFGVRDLLCGMKGYSRPVLAAYFDSGAPLLVNMAPAVVWRRGGGLATQAPVTGRLRSGSPRFGRALAANAAILRALWRVARLAGRATTADPAAHGGAAP